MLAERIIYLTLHVNNYNFPDKFMLWQHRLNEKFCEKQLNYRVLINNIPPPSLSYYEWVTPPPFYTEIIEHRNGIQKSFTSTICLDQCFWQCDSRTLRSIKQSHAQIGWIREPIVYTTRQRISILFTNDCWFALANVQAGH